MTEQLERASAPLAGTIWLGTAGAVLMVGGVAALLAANWHTVPFVAQVVVALLPLVLAWCGYGWYARRGQSNLALEEIVGATWTGGVVCSIALLGRVLQFASSSYLFCATVAALLVPVVYAVRSTVAWVACGGFAITAVVCKMDEGGHTALSLGLATLTLALGFVCLAPRLAKAWRSEGACAAGQRWLAVLMCLPAAVVSTFVAMEWLDDVLNLESCFALAFTFGLSWPLALGAIVEHKRGPGGRPLCLLGGILWCFANLLVTMLITEFGGMLRVLSWWQVTVVSVLLAASGRWVLRNEGLFLLLAPATLLAATLRMPLVGLGAAIVIGAAVIAVGVRSGKRSLANEGLLLLFAAGWCTFAEMRAGLMAQGLLLLGCGAGLIALNVVLAKLTKGGYHA